MATPPHGDDAVESSPPPTKAASVSRRRLLASLSATLGTSALTGRAVAAAASARAPADVLPDDVTRVEEEVWVEAPVDTDEDGANDRIHVRISRPDSTADGEQVPVIATASPYLGPVAHGDSTPEMLYDRAIRPSASSGDSGDGTSTDGGGQSQDGYFSAGDASAAEGAGVVDPRVAVADPLVDPETTMARLETRYLQQGYATAIIESLGTADSTGCYTAAGPPTIEAIRAVVDWFNGRATAYDAKEGGEEVTADWTNGRTGMIGTSALGELANGVAATGVDGLEAIVPRAANNGQYSLFRSNGTPISVVEDTSEGMIDLGTWIQASNQLRDDCGHWTEIAEDGQDHATGDYNDFWHDREFLTEAESVDAAVLITHAVDDPIVKPNNFADWYAELQAHDVPVRLWLHEGGHTAPRSQAWNDLLDRWWAHWLKGEDTGVMDEDPVRVVHDSPPMGDSGETYPEWPVPGTEATPVRLTSGGATAGGVTVDDSADAGDADDAEESLVDNPSVAATRLVTSDESDYRLRYQTPRLESSVHVSGKVVPDLALSFDQPTVVSVALVEYTASGAEIVSRGWVDPLNRPSYSEYDSPVAYKESLREASPLAEGEQVQVEFPLQATDHVFEAGSRIGLVVYASDRAFTLHPPGNATMTVSLSESSVALPVVGGESTLREAFREPGGEATDTPSETAGTATEEPTETATDATTTADGATRTEAAETTAAATTADAETTSGDGPGLGIASALAGLGGAGLLKRRLDNEGSEVDE